MFFFLYLFFILYKFQDTPTAPPTLPPTSPPTPPVAPSPPVTFCSDVGGYDLSALTKTQGIFNWASNSADAKISWSLCTTLTGPQQQGCGESGQICSTTMTGCCGMCQTWKEPSDNTEAGTSLGKFTGATADSTGVWVVYEGGDIVRDTTSPRTGKVHITCGSAGDQSGAHPVKYTEAKPGGPYIYILEVTSDLLCSGASGIGVGGWILIILFIFVIPGYLIGGILVNKFYFQAESTPQELIPNADFWFDTPKLFVEGLVFTKQKIMGLFGQGD